LRFDAGGYWGGSLNDLLSSNRIGSFTASTENNVVGFRLGAAVPEPSMMVIGMVFGKGGLAAKRRLKK